MQEESCIGQIEMLKEEVRIMLRKAVDPLLQLELIDNLQRLGLSYHFQSDIRMILESIYTNTSYQAGADIMCKKENLYSSALQFRLLRQHGYSMPQGKQNTTTSKCFEIIETLEIYSPINGSIVI